MVRRSSWQGSRYRPSTAGTTSQVGVASMASEQGLAADDASGLIRACLEDGVLQQLARQLVPAFDDSEGPTRDLLLWTLHAALMALLECNAVRRAVRAGCSCTQGHRAAAAGPAAGACLTRPRQPQTEPAGLDPATLR